MSAVSSSGGFGSPEEDRPDHRKTTTPPLGCLLCPGNIQGIGYPKHPVGTAGFLRQSG